MSSLTESTRHAARRSIGIGTLTLSLLAAACNSSTPAPSVVDESTTTTSTSSSTTTTSTTTTTTTAVPVIATAADVVASIEALYAASRISYEVESSIELTEAELDTAMFGILDNVGQALSMNFDFSGVTGAAEAGLGPLDEIRFILSETEGFLMFIDGEWGRMPADQVGELLEQALGIPLFDTGLALPYASLLFDSIIADPGALEDFTATGTTRRIGSTTLRSFQFTVPGTYAAGTLVSNKYAILAMTAPVEDERIEVEWWIDDEGVVRSASLNADSIVRTVYETLEAASPEAAVLAPEIRGGAFLLKVGTLDAPAIEFPDAADVEEVDISEVLATNPLIGPGTCYFTTEAASAATAGIVDCEEEHGAELFAVFDVPEADTYPGEDPVFEYGAFLCLDQAAAYSDDDSEVFVLFPTQDTWDLGDRRITCLYDFASPVTGSVARVPQDRVASFSLRPGQCLPPVDDLAAAILDLVDCSEPHKYEVVGLEFAGRWETPFPGADQLSDEAITYCNASLDELDPDFLFESNFLHPTAETWAIGDRVLVCIAEASDSATGSLLNP